MAVCAAVCTVHAEEGYAGTAAGSHSGGVEDGGCVAIIEENVEALNYSFEKAVNVVWSGKLKQGAENLGSAEWRALRR